MWYNTSQIQSVAIQFMINDICVRNNGQNSSTFVWSNVGWAFIARVVLWLWVNLSSWGQPEFTGWPANSGWPATTQPPYIKSHPTLHSPNWYSRWGRRLYFKVAAECFLSWDTIRGGVSFRIRFHLLSTVMEFTFQVRSKLLTFSLRKLSTSSFILIFSECTYSLLKCKVE